MALMIITCAEKGSPFFFSVSKAFHNMSTNYQVYKEKLINIAARIRERNVLES